MDQHVSPGNVLIMPSFWGPIGWALLKAVAIGVVAYLLIWCTTLVVEHDIARHFYAKCREDLGLFEPLTTLHKGQSACAARIETELGIVNRWEDEFR